MESKVNALGVVKNQVVHEVAVENIGIHQLGKMPVNPVVLDGAIEAFHVSVHLGCFGVGVKMSEV